MYPYGYGGFIGNWLLLIAVPNPHFPPSTDALALARFVAHSLDDITVETVDALG